MTALVAHLPRVPARLSRWLKPLLVAAGAVATIALLSVYVFPTRTWLDQRAELRRLTAEVDALDAERAQLEERVAVLDSDQEIEAIARSQFGLVLPGEEAYAVLPAPPPTVAFPPIWPFGQLPVGTRSEAGSGG